MPRLTLLCILSLSGCTFDYVLHSQTSTDDQYSQVKIGEICQNQDACEPGSKCVAPQFENCQNDINCALHRTRGDLQPKCRKVCDLNVKLSECPSSQRCVFHMDSKNGVCLNGLCDSDNDCGKNNALTNKCIDRSNGPKSGICALSCNPLLCHQGICPDCPTGQSACEYISGTVDFVCISGGDTPSFSVCDNEKLLCKPGHFCHQDQCRPYCNIKQQPTTCINNTWCRAFFSESEIGFCENNNTR
jgi:hypothetical protein